MARKGQERLLRQLEESLLTPEVRGDRDALARLLAPEWIEVGASGRVYTRDEVLASLPDEAPQHRVLSDFQIRWLAGNTALATYRVHCGGDVPAVSLRSSIWQRRPGGWVMVFHQGTPAPG